MMVGGRPTPLKNMNVSWDYYSQLNGQNMFQTTNQLVIIYTIISGIVYLLFDIQYNPTIIVNRTQELFIVINRIMIVLMVIINN
jgi:hypothetical protein